MKRFLIRIMQTRKKRMWVLRVLWVLAVLAALPGMAQQIIYASLDELLEERGDTVATLVVDKRSKNQLYLTGGADYRIESAGNRGLSRYLRRRCYAVRIDSTLYVNCRKMRYGRYRFGNWYAPAFWMGGKIYYNAQPVGQTASSGVVPSGVARLGGDVGYAIAASGLVNMRVYYELDPATGRSSFVDSDRLLALLEGYPLLKTAYGQNLAESAEVVGYYLLRLRELRGERQPDPVPCREERIFALSLLWRELARDTVSGRTARLDSLYLACLPRIGQAADNYAYNRALSAFLAASGGARACLLPPSAGSPVDVPPVQTGNAGTRVYVKNVARSLQADIPLRSEVVAVDGIPVDAYLRDSVFPYVGASDLRQKYAGAAAALLEGRSGSKVEVTVRPPMGRAHRVQLQRNASTVGEVMADTATLPPLAVRYLPGDIGLLHLTTCAAGRVDEIESVFLRHFGRLRRCKALLVDVRGNRGGTGRAWQLLARRALPGAAGPDSVPDSLCLRQPMAVLSDRQTASAAEDFVLLMKENRRATVVGEPTAGRTSDPVVVDLPGGYRALLGIKARVASAGNAILPDVAVHPTYQDVLEGRDVQLDVALEVLGRLVETDS